MTAIIIILEDCPLTEWRETLQLAVSRDRRTVIPARSLWAVKPEKPGALMRRTRKRGFKVLNAEVVPLFLVGGAFT